MKLVTQAMGSGSLISDVVLPGSDCLQGEQITFRQMPSQIKALRIDLKWFHTECTESTEARTIKKSP